MTESEKARAALYKQRRFLMLMSLVLIAYYVLGATLQKSGSVSGAPVHFDKPERALAAIWLIFLWATGRYVQCAIAAFVAIKNEILDVAEVRTRELVYEWAREYARERHRKREFSNLPAEAFPDAVQEGSPPQAVASQFAATQARPYPDRFLLSDGWRWPICVAVTFHWEEGGYIRSRPETFTFKIPEKALKRRQRRAWLRTVVFLPLVSEHIAPALLFVGAMSAALAHYLSDQEVADVNKIQLMIDWPWVHWGYFCIASLASLAMGLGAYKIHDPDNTSGERGARRWWQIWFNTLGAAVGWIAGWVVLTRWFGCAGFACGDEPRGWTIVLAVIAFAGIAGQLPLTLMHSIQSLRLVINKVIGEKAN